jgi:hypothetical protein
MTMLLVDLGGLGEDLLLRELARGLLNRGLIFGRREIHG